MTTTVEFTPQQKLTLIKHLAGGKDADMVATIMHTTRDNVIAVARHHGYPDTEKLAWAADILAKKIDEDDTLPERPLVTGGVVERPKVVVVSGTATVAPPTASKADDTLALLNGAKAHTSKRIQAAADRALDAIGRVRDLIAEDEEKHAEKRRLVAEKAAARAEVEKLEKQLAAAKAKLRGGSAPTARANDTEGEHGCPECQRTFGSAHGLGVHVGRAHGELREQAAS